MPSEKITKLCSKLITTFEQIPDIFKDGFKYSCLGCNGFPYSVYIVDVSEEFSGNNGKLVTVTEDGLFIFEKINSNVKLIQYNYDDIILVEKTNGLYNSTILIKGTINGRQYESVILFDNTDKYIFDFLIVAIRKKGRLSLDYEQEHEEKYEEGNYELLKLGYFKDSNLKLYNYSAESLLPHQIIKKTVLQKKLLKKKLKFIKEVITTSHIVILTNEELIIIEEGRTKRKIPESNIGGCWYFIPISQIEFMDIKAKDTYLLIFTIKLKKNRDIELLFEHSNKSQLEQLVRSSLSVYQQVSDNNRCD